MSDLDPYNQVVRQHFVNPAHAGDLPAEYTDTSSAEAGESDFGARVRLMLAQRDGRILAMRFRAWGCPHLIAAAETVCERFTGETVESLARFEPQRLMTMLAVPVEKSGRILLLEDALRLLYRAATGNKVDS